MAYVSPLNRHLLPTSVSDLTLHTICWILLEYTNRALISTHPKVKNVIRQRLRPKAEPPSSAITVYLIFSTHFLNVMTCNFLCFVTPEDFMKPLPQLQHRIWTNPSLYVWSMVTLLWFQNKPPFISLERTAVMGIKSITPPSWASHIPVAHHILQANSL